MKKILPVIILSSVICSGAGYQGSLPDINAEFEYLRKTGPQTSRPLFNHNQDTQSKLAPAPRDNKTYIDIILKKEQKTPYIDDINDVIRILEKMQDCILTNGKVQRFNALASYLIDNADFMRTRYKNQPEEHYITFKKIMALSAQARSIASLRCEAEIYIKYLPYQNEGQSYSKENIQKQISYFEKELEETLKLLRAAN